jgi:RNA polymerase sigma-70 factor (ECF subfamily)
VPSQENGTVDKTQTDLLWAVRDAENGEAWADFYRIYAPMARNFLRRLGLNDTEVDDGVQDIILLARDTLRRRKYDPKKGRFRAWLYGVARKKALMIRRARMRPSRVQAVSRDSGVDLLSGLEDHHADAERKIWEQEWRYALLDEALRQLQPVLGEKVFQAFVLYAIHQWPPEKVAGDLGISTSSVYVYKSRALDAVRDWIARFEDDNAEPDDPIDVPRPPGTQES